MRKALIFCLFVVSLLGFAAPAWADDGQHPEDFVVLSGHADVPAGQRVGDLVVFHGSSTVDGVVDGSLTAFDAPVTISGHVNGDVVVFNGRLVLRDGATVTGDVVTRDAPIVAPGATIGGTTRRVEANPRWDRIGWLGRFAFWLAVSLSTLIAGLVLLWLVGRGRDRIMEAASTRTGASIGWGLLTFFGLPILAIIALLTVVAIPLGIGVLAALGLIYAMGYCTSAFILGRAILRMTSWPLAFLLGWAILRTVALVPIVGGLTWLVTTVFGAGAMVVAIWRSRAGRPARPDTPIEAV